MSQQISQLQPKPQKSARVVMASDDEADEQEDFSQGQPLLEDVLAEFPDTTEVCPNITLEASLLCSCPHRKSI
jgi:hypothetical protein